jgi:butyrate kinase
MKNDINFNAKGLPLAAVVWQAPKIIGASVWAALAGCTFLIVFTMGTAHLKQKSLFLTKTLNCVISIMTSAY